MIGFLGGTGPEGRGLALRFAMAGESVMIGSRDAGRATDAADSVTADSPRTARSRRPKRTGRIRLGHRIRRGAVRLATAQLSRP